MKNMEKMILILGAVSVALLMVSSATAVPQTQSKAIMEKIEQLEEAEQLLMKLEASESLVVANNQEVFDTDAFESYLMSDELVNFMNSNIVANIISSDAFQTLYNTDGIQNFIQSEAFQNFLNSDVVQYFLEHYNPGGGNAVGQSSVPCQSLLAGAQQVNNNNVVNLPLAVPSMNEELEGSISTIESSVTNDDTGTLEMGVFAYLLIGIITWPFALGIFGLGAPFWGLWQGFWMAVVIGTNPVIWFVIFTLLGTLESIGIAILWPVVWGIFFP